MFSPAMLSCGVEEWNDGVCFSFFVIGPCKSGKGIIENLDWRFLSL